MITVPKHLTWYVIFLSLNSERVLACTTVVVGRKASADGSVIVTHSDDGEYADDPRVCRVPARDHYAGSRRQLYFWISDYPRYVGYDRCSIYEPTNGETPSVPIGSIPQVNHTYAYFEADYGLMNEHGVGMGESTCSGIFATNASGHGGKALMSFDELSRLAMERTRTAREAVQLMGELAEKYGFYGVGDFEGSAESLIVGDPMEAYIFHILPDPTGTSAIWAAQRVPDDHVGVVANMFVIRDINFDDPYNFLYSNSVWQVASDKGWWSPGQPFDFTKFYSDGEYSHKYYSGRRVWGAYRRLGVDLPDTYDDLRTDAVYPVTATPPKGGFSVRDIMSLHRDHYEGSKYDMTKGIAAGPWGNPDRWMTQPVTNLKGAWERSIGIFRTVWSSVLQLRSTGQGSVLWFGPHAAAGTCFVPMTIGTSVPAAYGMGRPDVLNRSSAYWIHRYLFNIAHLKYSYAISDIQAAQDSFEKAGEDVVRTLDSSCGKSCSAERLNTAFGELSNGVLKEFRRLSDELVAKYADGWVAESKAVGYPDWWLKAAGYQQGPPPPPTPPHHGPHAVGSMEDAEAQRCIKKCISEGFAKCAASCLSRQVDTPEVLV